MVVEIHQVVDPDVLLLLREGVHSWFSDLTSDLVYPAALVPHAFSPVRDVSHP